jgi:hypothetical protein
VAGGNGATPDGSGAVAGGNGATAGGNELVAGGSGATAGGSGVVAGGIRLTADGNGVVARGKVPRNDRARKGDIDLAWPLASSGVDNRTHASKKAKIDGTFHNSWTFIDSSLVLTLFPLQYNRKVSRGKISVSDGVDVGRRLSHNQFENKDG